MKDAQALLRMEAFATSMVLKDRLVAINNAQTMLKRRDYAEDITTYQLGRPKWSDTFSTSKIY